MSSSSGRRKRDDGGGGGVEDTLDRIIGTTTTTNGSSSSASASAASSSSDDYFVPSTTFGGYRHGYIFTTRHPGGTGYYRDVDTNSDGNNTKKRPRTTGGAEEGDEEEDNNGKKSSRKKIQFNLDANIEHTIPQRMVPTSEKLLEEAERSHSQSTTSKLTLSLDIPGLHKFTTSFLKTYTKNQMQRAQYPDEPTKFVTTELTLNDDLATLGSLAASPTPLYRRLVYAIDGGGGEGGEGEVLLPTLMALFSHDNVDLVITLVDTLNELLDVQLLSSSVSNDVSIEDVRYDMGVLANGFINGTGGSNEGGLEVLVSTMGRFQLELVHHHRLRSRSSSTDKDDDYEEDDEDDDNDDDQREKGIEGILNLVETLLDLDQLGVLEEAEERRRREERVGLNKGDDDDDGKQQSYQHQQHVSVVSRLWKESPTLLSWLLESIGSGGGSSSSSKKKKNGNKGGHHDSTNNTDVLYQSSELLATILQHEDSRMMRPAALLPCMPPFVAKSADDDDDDDDDEKKINGGDKKKETQLQSSSPIDGIEMLLQSIAPYRKKDPQTSGECEHLENCFDALSASMLSSSSSSSTKKSRSTTREDDDNVDDNNNSNNNLSAFLDAQGIELMLRCISSKSHAGSGALKVLFFALSGVDNDNDIDDDAGDNKKRVGGQQRRDVHKQACEQFVDAGGLKVIFPLFMTGRTFSSTITPKPASCTDAGSDYLHRRRHNKNNDKDKNDAIKNSKRGKRVRNAKREWLQEIEMNVIQILYALSWHLDDSARYDSKARLLSKFVESDFEKCDRLIELCLKYDEKMRLAEARYYRSEEAEMTEVEGGTDLLELAASNAKLKGGGELFYRLGALLGFASVGSKRCHGHILEQFRLKGSGISVVRAALEEFYDMLDEGKQSRTLKEYLAVI